MIFEHVERWVAELATDMAVRAGGSLSSMRQRTRNKSREEVEKIKIAEARVRNNSYNTFNPFFKLSNDIQLWAKRKN